MLIYLYLFIAILGEIIGTSALKLSFGFSRFYPSVVVVLGYGVCFVFLSLTLKTLPVGVVYAIWAGLGIVGMACIGIFYFNESFGLWHVLGTLLILIGVVILNLVTAAHH